uniref:Uncharacterized protein n=1 Tax=Avena sativa TaxID=4498 RepID=A0ACD5ZDT7_AVESA
MNGKWLKIFVSSLSVKVILDEQEKSKNGTIRSMMNEMKKYFMESYLTNCISVILNPRFKMEHVEFRLKQYFGVDAHKHIQKVKIAMKTLFIEYAAEIEDNVDFLSQEPNGEKVVADTVLLDWDEHVKVKKVGSRNELQRYLDEDFHPRTIDFDILNWWGVNSARYPTLGRIARDVLAVRASTVASESAFSICGRVITDHRSSLAPETVEALMCFGDWIKPGVLQVLSKQAHRMWFHDLDEWILPRYLQPSGNRLHAQQAVFAIRLLIGNQSNSC